MEVVGAVSSVVGILSFAGQAITGITRLNDFFRDCRSASKTVDHLLRDLESLKQTIEHTDGILTKLNGVNDSAVRGILASLQIQLEDCKTDVEEWVNQAQKSRSSLGGLKSTFKNFMLAVNKKSMKDIFTEVAVHRDNISLKLSILGRYQAIEHSVVSTELKSRLDAVADSNENNGQLTAESFQRLESWMNQLTTQQKLSFGSLESRASRIESLISFGDSSHRGSGRCSPVFERRDSTSFHSGRASTMADPVTSPSPSRMEFRSPNRHGSFSSRYSDRVSPRCSPSDLPFRGSSTEYEEIWPPQFFKETECFPASFTTEASPSEQGESVLPSASSLKHSTPPPPELVSYSAISTMHRPIADRPIVGSKILCDCCPGRPELFENVYDLVEHQHEQEHKYIQNGGQNESTIKNEIEAAHSSYLQSSWYSCAVLPGYKTPFHYYSLAEYPSDRCGYCGEEFRRSGRTIIAPHHKVSFPMIQEWEVRRQHLQEIHGFGECSHPKRFFRADHFLEHLKHSHNAKIGLWTERLMRSCLRNIGIREEKEQSTVKTAEILLEAIAAEYSDEKAEYLKALAIVGRVQRQSEIVSSCGELIFPCPTDPALKFLQDQLLPVMDKLEADTLRLRNLAWEGGCSLEDIDEMLQGQKNELPDPPTDNLEEGTLSVWRTKQLATKTRAWRTQTDRINAWLLQCLESSEEQAILHRSYLPKQLELHDDQWARQVLKFWPLDEAATWAGDRSCSTNGAVDSEGAAHSQRVFLEGPRAGLRGKGMQYKILRVCRTRWNRWRASMSHERITRVATSS